MLRAIARHGLILATGHLARDDTFAVVDAALEEGVDRHRRHASGVPVPELLDRGPERARRARLPARALPDHAVQREDDVGARLRRRPRGRHRAHALLERLREPGLSAGRGRPRALGRPPARRGVRRGRDARADRGAVAPAGGRGMTQEAPRDRRALGRLRLARGRRDRGHDLGRRRGTRARALLRRARRVRRALEGAGPDGRAREGDPARRGGAGGGRARRRVRVPRSRRLPARDRQGRARRDRRPHPRVRARRADHAHRSRPVQPGPRGCVLRRREGPRARRRRGRSERVRDRRAAGAAALRAAPAGALQLRARRPSSTSRP